MKGVVDVRQVHRALSEMGYPIRAGRGGRSVVEIDGTEISLPSTSKSGDLDQSTIGHLARAIGITRKELLEVFLGKTVANAGRPKAALAAEVAVQAPTKKELLAIVSDVRRDLGHVEEGIRSMFGDGEFGVEATRRALKFRSALLTAASDLSDAHMLTPRGSSAQGDGWTSPDDKGYQPHRYDPVTTGVARATGISASAAVRRTTVTKWQHDNLEAS